MSWAAPRKAADAAGRDAAPLSQATFGLGHCFG